MKQLFYFFKSIKYGIIYYREHINVRKHSKFLKYYQQLSKTNQNRVSAICKKITNF